MPWVNNGDYAGLLMKLAAAQGRDVPPVSAKAILLALESVPWPVACGIVHDLARRDSLPRNLVGAVENAADNYQREQEEQKYKSDNWASAGDCLTGAEIGVLMSIILEIMEWHTLKLAITRRADEITVRHSDIEAWDRIRNGQVSGLSGGVATWSPILDQFLDGAIKPYKHDKTVSGSLLGYFQQYLNMLTTTRKKRLREREDVKVLSHIK